MRADYLTYQRVTSECIRGLALQLVLTIAIVIYAVLARDHAAMSAAGYLGVGCIGWLCLCIVFDQHRRERIEAMEVDAMASTSIASMRSRRCWSKTMHKHSQPMQPTPR